MATDEELLEAWRGGDRSAGDELFERHFQSLYRFFTRKAVVDVADLVQRTFLACVEGKERFRNDSSIRTYLFSIARHELYGYWRKKKRAEKFDASVTSLHDLAPTPSEVAAGRQDGRLLLEALRRIPLDLQIAIELYYWEGMRGPELAAVLEIPEGTVRSRLRRGVQALRQRLEELASSPERLEETMTELDDWAASIEREIPTG